MFVAYRITRKETGKAYIGITQAARVKTRWAHHKNVGRKGIGAALKKYGEEAFDFSVIATCKTLDDVLEIERILIAQDGTQAPGGYNLNGGGKGNFNMAEHDRRKLGERNKVRVWTEESREKARQRLLGKKRSPESIAKTAAANTGKHPTPEIRAVLSAKAKERFGSPEGRAAQSKRNQERILSVTSRNKIAASLRAYLVRRLKVKERYFNGRSPHPAFKSRRTIRIFSGFCRHVRQRHWRHGRIAAGQ